MRGVLFGSAALCYAAALAIAWAGMHLPVPPPAAPIPEPVPIPAPAPAPSESRLITAVEDLAREQAESRELVSELRSTVARLQDELARQSAVPAPEKPLERTLAVFGGGLIPPGQETLDPAAGDVVRSLLPEIHADDRLIVSVEGHTDSRPIRTPLGKPFKDNADLSLLRARSVADLLAAQGVPAARIRVKGWGDTRPLATNDTAEGRDMNRRVEIRLLPATPEP